MSWWIWVLAGLLLLAIEFATTTMHIGLFAVGALVVAVLVAFGLDVPLWAQLLIFTGVSLTALAFVRPILVLKLKLHSTVKCKMAKSGTTMVVPANLADVTSMLGLAMGALSQQQPAQPTILGRQPTA